MRDPKQKIIRLKHFSTRGRKFVRNSCVQMHFLGRVIPSFRPKPTTNQPRSSYLELTLETSIAQQIFNGKYEYFLSSTRNRSRTPLHPSRTHSPLNYASCNKIVSLIFELYLLSIDLSIFNKNKNI